MASAAAVEEEEEGCCGGGGCRCCCCGGGGEAASAAVEEEEGCRCCGGGRGGPSLLLRRAAREEVVSLLNQIAKNYILNSYIFFLYFKLCFCYNNPYILSKLYLFLLTASAHFIRKIFIPFWCRMLIRIFFKKINCII